MSVRHVSTPAPVDVARLYLNHVFMRVYSHFLFTVFHSFYYPGQHHYFAHFYQRDAVLAGATDWSHELDG